MTSRTLQRTLAGTGLVGALLLASLPAEANSQTGKRLEPVTSEMVAVRVLEDGRGEELYVSAEDANPGDVLEYRVTYRNNTPERIRGLEATLPLPEGLEYLPMTATPRKVLASVDEARFDKVPLMKVVETSEGKREVVKVPYDQYRALRWKIGQLRGGESVVVKARARIAN